MEIRIGLAEDISSLAKAIAENLAMFKNVRHVFTARDGGEAIELLSRHETDLVLMDINMPGMNGIEATRRIRQLFPNVRVLMLTVFDDGDNLFQSILAGASGYLLKDEPPARLIAAIEDTMEGGAPMSPSIAVKALHLIRGQQPDPASPADLGLSAREMDILQHIAAGLTYQQIADKTFISPKTVRKHIENIYRKLQVHNKVEAIQLAQKRKLL